MRILGVRRPGVEIRTTLIVLILVPLVPALVLAGVALTMFQRQAQVTVEDGLLHTARAMAVGVDGYAQASMAALAALAQAPDLAGGDLGAFYRQLRRVKAARDDWENMVLYDRDGRQLLNLRVPFGTPISPGPRQQHVTDTIQTRAPVVSNLFMGHIAGKQHIVVTAPVIIDGDVRYVLGATLRLFALSDLLAQQRLPSQAIGSLVDRNMILIGRTRGREQFVGKRATADLVAQLQQAQDAVFEATTKDNQRVVAAFSRSILTGWAVVFGIPATALEGPLARSRRLLLGVGSVIVLCAIGVAAAVARRVSQRVEEEKQRLLADAERRRNAAESLADLGRVISRSLDPEEVAEQIVTSIAKLLGNDAATVYRLDEASAELVAVAASGFGRRIVRGTRVPLGMGTVGRVVRERQPVMSTDLLSDPAVSLTPELRALLEGGDQDRAVLSVPLIANDRVVGAIAVGQTVGWAFSDEQIHLVETFAVQAALALEHARLYEETRQRLRDTETLLAVSQEAGTTVAPREALRRITKLLVQAVGADTGGLLYFDAAARQVVPLAGYHVPASLMERMASTSLALPHPFFDEIRRLERPLCVSDSHQAARFDGDPWTHSFAHKSIMIVPVEIKGQVQAVFTLAWTRERHVATDDEIRLAEGIARQAGLGLANLQLLEGLERQQRRLEALLDATRRLSSLQPLETLLQQIAESCGQLLGTTSVGVSVVEGDALVTAGTWGDARELMPAARTDLTDGLVGGVVQTGEPAIVSDPALDPRVSAFARAAMDRLGYRSWLGVPIKVGSRVAGVLSIATRRDTGFSVDDVVMASALAAQAATTLENARLYQEVRQACDQLSQTQAQLTQAQKMEVVGRLAGGVAHDFNNLLTVIIGRTMLVRAELDDAHPVSRHVALIETAAQRAAGLTRQLLAFSRKQVLQPKVLDVNDVIRKFGTILRRLISEDIELTTELASALAPVKADPGQLDQVLMNLVVNARDAMPGGGRVTIETANVALDASYAARHVDVQAGAYVLLTVSDTGTGMDATTLAHLFEPFFTTKEQGKGTGLGLATVYGIVKQSGGHVAVYSELGLGTTFKVYLPVVEGATAPETNAGVTARRPRGTETILLVEDEEEVRDLVREVLETDGYTVLAAQNVDDALDICDRHADRIHLLMTDVVMPRMSGPDLAVGVRHRRPETKVLFMSGYTDGAIAHHGVLDPGVAFIQKPFAPAVISRRIREVLQTR